MIWERAEYATAHAHSVNTPPRVNAIQIVAMGVAVSTTVTARVARGCLQRG